MKSVKIYKIALLFLVIIIATPICLSVSSKDDSWEISPFREKNSQLAFKEKMYSQPDSKQESVDIFTDDQNNQYIYDKEGKQVGFIKDSDYSEKSGSMSCDDVKKRAEDTLKSKFNLDLYTLTDSVFEEATKTYIFTYHRIIENYKTSDFIFIVLSENGDILSYAAPYAGSFDNIDIPVINEETYIDQLSEYLNNRYSLSMREYHITDKMIVLNEGVLEFSLTYVVVLDDGTKVGDVYKVKL